MSPCVSTDCRDLRYEEGSVPLPLDGGLQSPLPSFVPVGARFRIPFFRRP